MIGGQEQRDDNESRRASGPLEGTIPFIQLMLGIFFTGFLAILVTGLGYCKSMNAEYESQEIRVTIGKSMTVPVSRLSYTK
jgi:hypothetical protein